MLNVESSVCKGFKCETRQRLYLGSRYTRFFVPRPAKTFLHLYCSASSPFQRVSLWGLSCRTAALTSEISGAAIGVCLSVSPSGRSSDI